MSRLSERAPRGVLRPGWTAPIAEYGTAVAWSPDGTRVLAADAGGGVYALDGRSGAVAWGERGAHPGGALALAVQPSGGVLVSGGQDRRLRFVALASGELRASLEAEGWVTTVVWSPAGDRVAAAAGRRVLMCSAVGELLWASEAHPSTVTALAWSPRGQVVSTCYGQVSFLDAATGARQERFEWKGSLLSLAQSPDGEVIACGSQDGSVHFWRRSTGQDSTMSGYPLKPVALAFDADGRALATGGGSTVTVWSFDGAGPEGTEPALLELHDGPVTALAFSHRGRRLASASKDGGVIVWALDRRGRGDAVGAAFLDGEVEALRWRSDDRALAAVDGRGHVATWRVG